MTSPQPLYLLAEDLYRMGNAEKSKLENVRTKDVDVYDRNGIDMVRANGKGISLITEARLARLPRGSGYAWKLPAYFRMPQGLVLHADRRDVGPGQQPEHYFLGPLTDMPLSEYTGLLSNLALHLERIRKI